MYQPSKLSEYLSARKSLTFFAVITILLILVTIVNAIWCTTNFHKGLKPHLVRTRDSGDSEKATELGTRVPGEGVPGRMMID
jgi:amino acid transporter